MGGEAGGDGDSGGGLGGAGGDGRVIMQMQLLSEEHEPEWPPP